MPLSLVAGVVAFLPSVLTPEPTEIAWTRSLDEEANSGQRVERGLVERASPGSEFDRDRGGLLRRAAPEELLAAFGPRNDRFRRSADGDAIAVEPAQPQLGAIIGVRARGRGAEVIRVPGGHRNLLGDRTLTAHRDQAISCLHRAHYCPGAAAALDRVVTWIRKEVPGVLHSPGQAAVRENLKEVTVVLPGEDATVFAQELRGQGRRSPVLGSGRDTIPDNVIETSPFKTGQDRLRRRAQLVVQEILVAFRVGSQRPQARFCVELSALGQADVPNQRICG